MAARVSVGGFLLHLCLGTMYCWGNLTTYITSYLRGFEPDLSTSSTLVVFGLAMIGQACSMYAGGKLEQHFGPKRTAIAGLLLVVASALAASFCRTVAELAVSYGVLFGTGVGIAYACPLVAGMRWSPARKGLINGIVTAGFGLGAFVFDFVITAFVNPDDLEPCSYGGPGLCNASTPHVPINPLEAAKACCWADPTNNATKFFNPQGAVARKIPQLLQLLAAVYAVVGFVGCLLIENPPGDREAPASPAPTTGYDATGERSMEPLLSARNTPGRMINADDDVDHHIRAVGRARDMRTRDVIRSPQGWIMGLMFLLTASGGVFMLGTCVSALPISPPLLKRCSPPESPRRCMPVS